MEWNDTMNFVFMQACPVYAKLNFAHYTLYAIGFGTLKIKRLKSKIM